MASLALDTKRTSARPHESGGEMEWRKLSRLWQEVSITQSLLQKREKCTSGAAMTKAKLVLAIFSVNTLRNKSQLSFRKKLTLKQLLNNQFLRCQSRLITQSLQRLKHWIK